MGTFICMSTVFTAFIVLNLFTLVLFGVDKYLAIHNRYRISEKNLLFLTILGGSIGAISAQKLFRHKTKKFKYILWVIALIQFIAVTIAWNYPLVSM